MHSITDKERKEDAEERRDHAEQVCVSVEAFEQDVGTGRRGTRYLDVIHIAIVCG